MEKTVKTKDTEDFLVYPLEKEVVFEGNKIETIDLTSLREMTLDELAEIYDAYEVLGGSDTIAMGVPLRFLKLVIQNVTGISLEALGRLSARDTLRLRARVYRFFYLSK